MPASARRPDRFAAAVLLLLVPFVCWIWVVVMARDMYGPMTGASAWMMTPVWDARHLLLLWTMWAVMMAAMMLPTASPVIAAYARIADRTASDDRLRRLYAIGFGYVAAWMLFSVGATALQRVLSRWLLLSAMMESTRAASAALLLIAAVYQATPLKQACLRTCRSPAAVLIAGWRDGAVGAFVMGLEHGASCVGCCWALMLLLFAGGVMNLAVIAALTAFVAFEKLAPFGERTARSSALLLAAAAVWMLVRA